MRTYDKTHDQLTQACAYIGSMLPKKINGFTPVITLKFNEFEMAWNLELSVKERIWVQHLAHIGQEANGGIVVTSEIPRETMRRVKQIFKIKHDKIVKAPQPWYEKYNVLRFLIVVSSWIRLLLDIMKNSCLRSI